MFDIDRECGGIGRRPGGFVSTLDGLCPEYAQRLELVRAARLHLHWKLPSNQQRQFRQSW
jgi:hypothetical protein